jgi:hypothetical protein
MKVNLHILTLKDVDIFMLAVDNNVNYLNDYQVSSALTIVIPGLPRDPHYLWIPGRHGMTETEQS